MNPDMKPQSTTEYMKFSGLNQPNNPLSLVVKSAPSQMIAKPVKMMVHRLICKNTICAIVRYSVNIEVNLKYNAMGIEQNKLTKSAQILGLSPILLAYGSHIIRVAAMIMIQVPVISQLFTGLQHIRVMIIVIGPCSVERVIACDCTVCKAAQITI